jgi:signal transduction histidine kinase
MIKKYPWHFVYLIFVIICLANIFQKLKWNTPTDHITWQESAAGLVCLESPADSPVKPGDILLTAQKYVIAGKMDLYRVIETRKFCLYEIEREGLLKTVGVEILNRYTPLSYYIMVFSGIFFILLTLNILNAKLRQGEDFFIPRVFLLLSLSFSGFLILSPTGTYSAADFGFFLLDRTAFMFFPALLLHYSLFYPIKSAIFKRIKPRFLLLLIYTIPATIFLLFLYYLVENSLSAIPQLITLTLNHFRAISNRYFSIFLAISLVFFLISNLAIVIKKRQKRYAIPLGGTSAAILYMGLFTLLIPSHRLEASVILNLSLVLFVLLPPSLAYYLTYRRLTDMVSIIKRTAAIASIFFFIFGIFFFLGINIEKNKLLGIFWSVTTIITAGLLYKPIEGTVQHYFERLFLRGTYNFKNKLRELIQSLRSERNISLLAKNFLDTVNHGFNLEHSAFMVHHRKNVFYSLPKKNKVLLSKGFRNALFENDNLVFYAESEFKRRFPKDHRTLQHFRYNQFFPLKTQDRLVGLVAFGPKEDNTLLSIEDWELLFSISSSLTLSVENASLYGELENQLTELNLLKEFNENIIENLNLGIVVLSKLNIIRTWNIFMESKFNIMRGEAINKKAYSILGTNLWKQIQGMQKGTFSLNNIHMDSSEEELIFDIYISPLKDNFGSIIGTILVFEDVTEKTLIQNQLITTEKMASLGFLSAGIAHEINTPLTGISSYCQFILDNPGNPENTDLISRIQEQVQRANRIISTLLDFSRQKGEQPIETDLNQTIEESISLVEHKLKKKDIRLEKRFHFEGRLNGFANRLQQLFINLFINSIDAISGEGGVITIEGKETEDDLLVYITDSGEGIDPKSLKRIFDPFFTTKDPGRGTGLGLSIAYNIVKDHYGDIQVESHLNQGTRFSITLPKSSPLRSIKI